MKKGKRLKIFAVIDESILLEGWPALCESQFNKADVKVVGTVVKKLKTNGMYLIDFGIFAGEVKCHQDNLTFLVDTTL